MADIDSGDSLTDIASRFNLKLKTSPAIKRGETFGGLNSAQALEAYQTPMGNYQTTTSGGVTSIITPIKIINPTVKTSASELTEINHKITKDIEADMAEELVNSYARDMDVRIKYKLMGLDD